MKRTKDEKMPKNASKPVTKEALIEQANIALAKLQPELSKKIFQKALDLFPDDTNLMDALADVHLQLGDNSQALRLLQRSTEINPEENPFKWLFLAQLQSGKDSLNSYLKAIELIENLVAVSQDNAEVNLSFIKHLSMIVNFDL
jgi:tetratricopeptide (TPR) repeat protein